MVPSFDVAFEAISQFDGKITKNMAFAAIVFVSAYVPSQGWGYGLLNARSEALWETLVAMLLSMIIVTPIWDGGIMKNALKAFVLSTSSYAVLEQLNILFRGGVDPRYNSYRNQFEPPTNISLMTLG